MKTKTYILGFITVAILLAAGFFVAKKVEAPANNAQQEIGSNQDEADNTQLSTTDGQEKTLSQTVDPLSNALSRITKKPFGIFVSPKNSPVSPEKFSGFHTAVDLEATNEEQSINVPVRVLCAGKLRVARIASGYGGVAVQDCILDEKVVTVIYGHIDLTSMQTKVGDQLEAGDFLANLGKGFSSQTDGERKHLHLGIHKGTSINILGYVQSERELSDWIDPQKYLD
jgi:murein DD-endopeptidase MepM/ murein hydrolase activator NlpD